MGKPLTGVKGIVEVFSLAGILGLPANANANLKSFFWDHTDDVLKQGPEGSRTAVAVTGFTPVWSNMYGTSLSTSQDETTADAPVQFGDADNVYGDNSDVTSIVHNASFEGVYSRLDPYWALLKAAKDGIGNQRLLYYRFFPEGKAGSAEVTHGVVEPRGFSRDMPREDFLTFSVDFVYKTKEYNTVLPSTYPLA